jgi:hypothetical protein
MASRAETRREHSLEIQSIYAFKSFTNECIVPAVESLEEIAWQIDKSIVLAEDLIQYLRIQSILLPSINVIERICAEAITKSTRRIHATLTEQLTKVDLRRRVNAGLNKGESKNALARAVFFNRLGEMRDRSFEHQQYRASGLNLVVAAIILWNTVYLEKAIQALRDHGKKVDDHLLRNLSPLGWEHINLTGDYIWKQTKKVERSKFRSLRPVQNP